LKIGEDANDVNPEGAFINYGIVKNPYILIKGSVGGAKKRLIIFKKASRKKKAVALPTVEYASLGSKQGR